MFRFKLSCIASDKFRCFISNLSSEKARTYFIRALLLHKSWYKNITATCLLPIFVTNILLVSNNGRKVHMLHRNCFCQLFVVSGTYYNVIIKNTDYTHVQVKVLGIFDSKILWNCGGIFLVVWLRITKRIKLDTQ